MRPSVVSMFNDDALSSTAGWWKLWKSYMFEVCVRERDGDREKREREREREELWKSYMFEVRRRVNCNMKMQRMVTNPYYITLRR